jgi:hypothetical protein
MAIKRWNGSTSQWELVGTPGTASPSAIGAASIANANTFASTQTIQGSLNLTGNSANKVNVSSRVTIDTSNAWGSISLARQSTSSLDAMKIQGADSTGTANALRISNDSGNGSAIDVYHDSLRFYVNSSTTERMRIDANGNVSLAVQGNKVLIGSLNHTNTVASLSIKNPIASGASLNYAIMINDPNTNTSNGFNLIGFSHNDNDYSAANVRASIGATINAGGQGSLVFRTGGYGSQLEALRIDPNANLNLGGSSSVDTLRYLDIQNTNSGNSAGTIIRFITNNAANTAVTTVDMVKYRNGTFVISNNDTGASAIFQFSNAGAERMRIDGNGYLLVGYTGSQGAYKLQVNSQIFATSSSIATSDGRYKENVLPITSGLDIIDSLNPVSFDWKEHPVHNFVPGKTVGFIAQEVQEALKAYEWVDNIIKTNVSDAVLDEEGNEVTPSEEFLGIAESNIIPLLVAAVKELRAEVNTLKAQITN